MDHQRPRRAHNVPASDTDPDSLSQLAKTLIECRKVVNSLVPAKSKRDHSQSRNTAHCRQIGEIDGQRLVAKALPVRPIHSKMDILNQAIRGDHDLLIGRGLPDRSVIPNAHHQSRITANRFRQRLRQQIDQLKLAHIPHSSVAQAHLPSL
jgi:hypothetical protein